MEKLKKTIRCLDSITDKILFFIFLFLFLIGLYAMYDSFLVYQAANDTSILKYKPGYERTAPDKPIKGNIPAELPYTKGTETGKLKVTDGVVEFTLSDGESITLGNILIDTTYKITEVDGASNGYAVESTNSSGTLTEDTNVSFTNTRNGTVPTSAHTNILISIGVFAIALAGLFWHLRKRKQ